VTRLAILGATGAVGTTLLRVLEERSFPLEELRLLASERSAGRQIPYAGRDLTVQAVGPGSFEGIDIAIFSAGATRSREWAPRAVAAGAVVVDNSSAFRMDEGVPLVVADVNPHAARNHAGVIANPNCSTMQLVPVLSVLHARSPLEHVTVSTYQSVSGTGQKAIDALRAESAAVLAGEEPPAGVYAHRIAFNVLPFAGSLSGDDGYTDEELKLVNESRKILELPDLRVSATCVRVPVVNSHSEAVWVRTREPISPGEARALLAAHDGITVVDDPSAHAYPMAIDADGKEGVLVGRIRRDLGDPNALALWVVADNLRKGAASNAVDIAELLVRDSLLRSAAA
jgi:aspartate-semialdehyde dehydrogenase